MNIEAFREEIDSLLRQHERTQAYLARSIGVAPDRLYKWLVGQNRLPYEAIGDICRFFDLSPKEQLRMYRMAGYELPSWVEDLVAQKQSQTGDIDVRIHPTHQSFFLHENERMRQAERTVCDVSWGTDMPHFTQAEAYSYDEYINTIPSICHRGVIYREVMTFHNDPIHFLDKAEKLLGLDLISYNLRYFDIDLKDVPPLMHFMVIDEVEVCCALYRWPHLPVADEVRLSVRHPDIARLFQDYFDTIWVAANSIKDGDVTNWPVFHEIKRALLPRG